MWEPETVQLPKSVVLEEMKGNVPAGTTLALAVLLTTKLMQKPNHVPGLDPTAVKVAQKFYEMGQIVTGDGEILTETPKGESLEKPSPNLPSVPQDSNDPIEDDMSLWDEQITEIFRTAFPNHVTPTVEQMTSMFELATDIGIVADALLIAEHSSAPVTTPPGFVLYLLRKKPHAKLAEEATILRRKDATSPETIVARALRKAEQQIKELPDPGPTPERTERLRKLSEARHRG